MQATLLERRSISELQEMWKKYFDSPPTTYNKEFYISRIAHRIQELAYGGLSANQQKLIANMYVPPEDRNNLPPAGTGIVRIWKFFYQSRSSSSRSQLRFPCSFMELRCPSS